MAMSLILLTPPPCPAHPQAFSAYFFVMNFLNLTDTSIPLEAVKQQLAHYCSTPWDQVGPSLTPDPCPPPL